MVYSKTGSGSKQMFEPKRNELLRSLAPAHAAYYKAAVFSGPSLHFHLRALAAAEAGNRDAFGEATYAMLVSWGMHGAGPRGSKMVEFDEFAASLTSVWPLVMRLQGTHPPQLTDQHWEDLEALFYGIKAMKSGTSLVGTSKVMAHALPKLIAPVDRRYTLRFIFGSEQIRNDRQAEWATLRRVLEDFFYPVVASPRFVEKAKAWMKSAEFRWDTSPLKVVDNLLIGSRKPRAVHAV